MKIQISEQDITTAIMQYVASQLSGDVDTSKWTVSIATTRNPIAVNATIDLTGKLDAGKPSKPEVVRDIKPVEKVAPEPVKEATKAIPEAKVVEESLPDTAKAPAIGNKPRKRVFD